jgi:hypothetical protein
MPLLINRGFIMSKVTTAIDTNPPILDDGYMDIGGGSSNGEFTGNGFTGV